MCLLIYLTGLWWLIIAWVSFRTCYSWPPTSPTFEGHISYSTESILAVAIAWCDLIISRKTIQSSGTAFAKKRSGNRLICRDRAKFLEKIQLQLSAVKDRSEWWLTLYRVIRRRWEETIRSESLYLIHNRRTTQSSTNFFQTRSSATCHKRRDPRSRCALTPT